MSSPKQQRRKRHAQEPVDLTSTYRARRRLVLGLFGVALLTLLWRAVDQQILQGDFLRSQGAARHVRVMEIPAYRGRITDRYGEPLAISSPVVSVWASPRELLPERPDLRPLAKLLELDPSRLQRELEKRSGRGFYYLRRQLTPAMGRQVEALGLPGIGLEREYRRYYPSGEVTAHLVGFTDIDERGQEGLERAYDDWLRGRPGSKRVIKDGRNRVVKDLESVSQPQPGRDLVLSIDRRVQYLAYRGLKAAVVQHKAQAGTAVILDVDKAEVLAMVNQPAYNPNAEHDNEHGRLRNRALTDVLEPGSTMKPFTVAAALEAGIISPETIIDTSPGLFRVGSQLVRDHRNLGPIDIATLLRKSSNVGASKLALSLTAEQLWSLYSRVGFGTSTGSTYPGEVTGQLPDFRGWSRFERCTLSFGYGLSVTSLQLAQAYGVLAADGVKRPLSLLVRDEVPPGERVIGVETARRLRGMLETVVSADGTAPKAAVPGYRVAGKTGTARKSIAGGYAKDKYQALFAGMAPASDPRLVMVVMIDEPRAGAFYGGAVAAPVFAEVMAGALRLLNVPPDNLPQPGVRVADAEVHP